MVASVEQLNGYLYIHGKGFSRTGGNTVELTNYPRAVTYNPTDQSHTLIVLQLGELVSPGLWTLSVSTSYASRPSPPYAVFIK